MTKKTKRESAILFCGKMTAVSLDLEKGERTKNSGNEDYQRAFELLNGIAFSDEIDKAIVEHLRTLLREKIDLFFKSFRLKSLEGVQEMQDTLTEIRYNFRLFCVSTNSFQPLLDHLEAIRKTHFFVRIFSQMGG